MVSRISLSLLEPILNLPPISKIFLLAPKFRLARGGAKASPRAPTHFSLKIKFFEIGYREI